MGVKFIEIDVVGDPVDEIPTKEVAELLRDIKAGVYTFKNIKVVGQVSKADQMFFDRAAIFQNVHFERTTIPLSFSRVSFIDCVFEACAIYMLKEAEVTKKIELVGCKCHQLLLVLFGEGQIESSRFEECAFEGQFRSSVVDSGFYFCDFTKSLSLELSGARLYSCALPVAQSQVVWAVKKLFKNPVPGAWPQLRVTYTPLKFFFVFFASLFFVFSEAAPTLNHSKVTHNSLSCNWGERQEGPVKCRVFQLLIGYNQQSVVLALATLTLFIYNLLRLYLTYATVTVCRITSTSTMVPKQASLARLTRLHIIVSILSVPAFIRLFYSAFEIANFQVIV